MDDKFDLQELLEVMDELGRAKLNEGLALVQAKRLRARVAELENAQVAQPSKPRAVEGKAA